MPKGVYARTPRTYEQIIKSVRERLEALSEPVPATGCWIFTGTTNRLGYGYIAWNKHKRMPAHRASYIVHVGPIPTGFDVCHKCDVRSCVNPDHLWAGSHQENMADMVAKGRSPRMPGEQHPNAILNDDAVRFIRASNEPKRLIAKLIGVSPTTIGDVRSGKSWKHVN